MITEPSQDLPERPKACLSPHRKMVRGWRRPAVVGCHMSGPETRIWPVDDDGMLTMMMQPKFLVIPRAESRGSWSSGGPEYTPRAL